MRAIGLVVLPVLLAAMACSSGPPPDPLQLDRGLVKVDNQSEDEWRNVEIWVNNYYRAVAVSIPAHSRYQAQLDTFISGWGQRFNFQRAQITDLRLSARKPNGESFELKKRFQGSMLDEALQGKH